MPDEDVTLEQQASLDGEIQTLRDLIGAAAAGSGLRPAMQAQLDALYQRRYPAPAGAADATDPDTLALPKGPQWDRAAVAEVYDAATREGIDRSAIAGLVNVLAGAALEESRWTPAGLKSYMIETAGAGSWEGSLGIDVRAGEVLRIIPPALRAKIQGLEYNPAVARYLAEVLYPKIFNPLTTKGAARIKERFAD